MNQIKYSAYALLLVLGLASVALFINKLSSVPSAVQNSNATAANGSSEKKMVVNVAGKNLFQSNCQTCHSITKNLTGPALKDVEQRGPWTDRNNLAKWLKNPAVMINENAYAKALSQQYNGQIMPSFQHLDDKQIGDIFDYIKEAAANENSTAN